METFKLNKCSWPQIAYNMLPTWILNSYRFEGIIWFWVISLVRTQRCVLVPIWLRWEEVNCQRNGSSWRFKYLSGFRFILRLPFIFLDGALRNPKNSTQKAEAVLQIGRCIRANQSMQSYWPALTIILVSIEANIACVGKIWPIWLQCFESFLNYAILRFCKVKHFSCAECQ